MLCESGIFLYPCFSFFWRGRVGKRRSQCRWCGGAGWSGGSGEEGEDGKGKGRASQQADMAIWWGSCEGVVAGGSAEWWASQQSVGEWLATVVGCMRKRLEIGSLCQKLEIAILRGVAGNEIEWSVCSEEDDGDKDDDDDDCARRPTRILCLFWVIQESIVSSTCSSLFSFLFSALL